ARHPLLRQGLLRAHRVSSRAEDHRRCTPPARAAVPVSARRLQGAAREVPECHRGRVGPGRAAKPGRGVPAPGVVPCPDLGDADRFLRRPSGRRNDGGRVHVEGSRAAETTDRGRLRAASAFRRRNAGADLTEGTRMQVEVKVPQLPESVAEATLLNWHKKAGETFARDENLVDVETEKVLLELPAPAAGALVEIRKGDGSTVAGQEVIAIIDTESKGAAAAPPAATAIAQPAAPSAKAAPTPAASAPPPAAGRPALAV